MNKLNLAILCGGQSAEHEVSIISAKNVIAALDKNKYNVLVIFITKQGAWFLFKSPDNFLNSKELQSATQTEQCKPVSLVMGRQEKKLYVLNGGGDYGYDVDVAFPVLHGSHGEDGTMQGLLELANIPYVGAGVLGSAICMDKEISKKILAGANIPVVDYLIVKQQQKNNLKFSAVKKKLGLPVFIKPANTGSSVGVFKAKNQNEFKAGMAQAFQFDNKILIEKAIKGREIECSVLGNEKPQASLPGEIVCHHEFYSYEAKYIDPNGASLVIPAPFPKAVIKKIQTIATQAYTALACEGMARVDFFVTPRHKIYINEANTIPGFTQISMYPKMWHASGVSYSDLLDKLITLALQRFERNQVLVANKNLGHGNLTC